MLRPRIRIVGVDYFKYPDHPVESVVMATANGFWSYLHADDQAEKGRIADLARDVVEQFEMLTGESIELFLDRDAIEWGDDWKSKIDASLAAIAFFIPVLTPRYFGSAECRRELQFFARRARNLGVGELVLPLLYVDFPALRAETPDDDLIGLVREFRWEDWTSLRFADRESASYREAVAKLAQRLVDANAAADAANAVAAAESLEESEDQDEESPGTLDLIAAAEEAMPRWVETLEQITSEIESLGGLLNRSSTELQESDRRGKGFAGRLRVARQLAQNLSEPSSRILALGNDFATQLHAVDEGVRALIEHAAVEVRDNPEAKSDVCEFFDVVRNFANTVDESLGALQGMLAEITPVESLSRELRPTLRTMRQGLTLMLEAGEVSAEWVRLIDDAGINCTQES